MLVGLYFSQFLLTPVDSLANQWQIYINPFNNLFLYVSGIAIFYNFKELVIEKKVNMLILIICWILFSFLPFEGDQIIITTGVGRIIFLMLSILVVIAFYKLKFKFPTIIKNSLSQLGAATYSVYLLHPIVISFSNILLMLLLNSANPVLQLILATTSTIIISLMSYKYFETPFITLGKRLTSNQIKINEKKHVKKIFNN